MAHQLAHAQPQALEVDHHIHHQLAGAVIGDLAATVGFHQRNIGGAQQMLGLAGQAQGVHRRVLHQP